MKVQTVTSGPSASAPVARRTSEAGGAERPKAGASVPSGPAEAGAAQRAKGGGTFDLRVGVTKEFLQEALTTRIGKAVEERLQAHGLSLSDTVGVDWSAEGTSDRIVAGTTGMLGIFARQNPEMSKSELIDAFEKTIRGGIQQGFDEAIGILEAMEGFDDSIRGLGQKTMQLVGDKLDSYFANLRESIKDEA